MKSLWQRALDVMPGGVSSPVRAFGAVPGQPPIVVRGHGALIEDAEGHERIDMVGSWGPLILGHAHPAVIEAVIGAARDGLSFGATCEREIELAEAVAARFSFVERVRFVSSGTEAVMSAVRLARGHTGRSRIVKFEGCYHGHSDGLLVKAGSGLVTLGSPSSAGVPPEIAGLTEVLPLDDEQAARELFARCGDEIACVLVEPLPANNGLLIQRQEFLQALRELTRAHGALLIFDEVISGLRVAPGGMCQLTGIEPDLVTLGKIVGGGMPVGAYGGPRAIMEDVAPTGPVYQAGTLSGNPVAMAAGLATLRELERPGVYQRLEDLGARLESGWRAALEAAGIPGQVLRVGSILWLALQDGPPPRSAAAIDPGLARRYGPVHADLLRNGVWMAPSAYEVAFLSTAHEPRHVERVVEVLGAALQRTGSRGEVSPA